MDIPELFLGGCLLGWVVLVWLITKLLPRPTATEDREQAEHFSRPAPLDPGPYLREIQRTERIKAGQRA